MLRKIINITVSRIKGETFELDSHIPLGYLFHFFLSKVFMLIYGIVKLRRMKRVFVHHTSVIKCQSLIRAGRNLVIDCNCYIDALSTEGISFGTNVSIGKNTTIICTGTLKKIGTGFSVGNNVGLGTHGFMGCAGGVAIGDNTILGNYVSIHSENHNYDNRNKPIRLQGVCRQGVSIGKDCWIGAKVTILDGAVIGDGCVVAAGSVVRGTIPPFSVIGGIPARVIKQRGSN